jgi:cardiolipin synthase
MDTKLLVEGEAAFKYIFEKFENAKEHILINMFIWRFDCIGILMAENLLKAANRGVKITIIKDKLGGVFEIAEESRKSFFHNEIGVIDKTKAYWIDKGYPMRGKGKLEVVENPMFEAMKQQKNIFLDVDTIKSDHSKYYIIDDEILIMGGINIEDKEIYKDAEGKGYHDYMIGIEDAAMVDLFKKRMAGQLDYDPSRQIDFIFNIFNDGREKGLDIGDMIKGIKDPLLNYIRSAKSRLDIIIAYLGDKDINQALIDAAHSGVKVNLMIPKKANLQQDTNLRIAKELLRKTNNQIRVYLNPKMVHAKMMVVDECFLNFGSANYNKQAFNYLGELNISLDMGNEMATELMNVLDREYKASKFIGDIHEIKYNRLKALIERCFC